MDNIILRTPKDRNLFFTKQVDQDSISELSKSIIEINSDDENLSKNASILGFKYEPQPIKIYIDSYGGSVYQILGVVSIIEKSTTPIHTIVTGCAMSCGFILLISGHKRFGYKYSTPLYHQVSLGASGEISWMDEKVQESKRLQKLLEDITLSKTKITKERLEKIYREKIDWYMTPIEAKKLGVIDEII
jgi:ATP-dependent Clp protease, protease subunit